MVADHSPALTRDTQTNVNIESKTKDMTLLGYGLNGVLITDVSKRGGAVVTVDIG